jgi:glucose-1-phosphate thymidylyltransferase
VKGVILAGGLGTRLRPATLVISKQLLPVYDKPMIYYPLSTLIHAGCSEVLLISSSSDLPQFEKLLSHGEHLGIRIHFLAQDSPDGVAQGIKIAEQFLEDQDFWFILGDNLFHGPRFGSDLQMVTENVGCHAFAYHVNNPSDYGVVKFTADSGEVERLVEKPSSYISSWAIPGLYYFDKSAPERTRQLTPSLRGELEILDLLKLYQSDQTLKVEKISRGNAWFDLGTALSLLRASEFVQIVQERQGQLVGSPEEASFNAGFSTASQLQLHLEKRGSVEYGRMVQDALQSW